MRKTLEARHRSNQNVIKVLIKYEEKYKTSSVMVDAVAQYRGYVDEVAQLNTQVSSIPSKISGNKNMFRDNLVEISNKLGKVLNAYATINKDENMKNFVNVSTSVLSRKYRDQQLLDYSKGVKERIEPLIESLTQYGVSKELVDEFYTNINTFEGLINEPRELINTRKTINEIIEDKIAKASELLTTTIDGLMELFNDQWLILQYATVTLRRKKQQKILRKLKQKSTQEPMFT